MQYEIIEALNKINQTLKKDWVDYSTLIFLGLSNWITYKIARETVQTKEDAQTPILKGQYIRITLGQGDDILSKSTLSMDLINVGFDHFNLLKLEINKKNININESNFHQFGGSTDKKYNLKVDNIALQKKNNVVIKYKAINNRIITSKIEFNIEDRNILEMTEVTKFLPSTEISIKKYG
jgi:hypothetical protein